MFLHEVRQFLIHARTAHVRRIGDDDIVFLSEYFGDADEVLEPCLSSFEITDEKVAPLRVVNGVDVLIEELPVVIVHLDERAVLSGVGEGIDEAFELRDDDVFREVIHSPAEIGQAFPIDVIAIYKIVEMTRRFAAENTTAATPAHQCRDRIGYAPKSLALRHGRDSRNYDRYP